MTNPRKVYRDAAQLAAIQLDRPFTAQDIARIEACIEQANISQNPNDRSAYDALKILVELTPQLSTETYKPLAALAAVEEALDEATRRVAQAFAPAMPKTSSSDSSNPV